ncbi:MAG: winged helix-turn-helix transcriptional regulator [Theionarchaea archaeon]|nr:winged helix-turn-helix transcriptional regulator [Theionarchaea archaeon]
MRVLVFFLLAVLQGSTYTIEVTETGYAVISHEIAITASEDMDSFTYYVPFTISHLQVYSDKAVEGEFIILGGKTEVTLYFYLKKGESVYCICEYLTWEIVSKEGDQWWLYLPAMEEPMTVIIPEGAAISYLVTESDFPSVSEERGRITLFWDGLPEEVYIYYELSFEESSTPYFLVIPLVGLVGVIGIGLKYFRKRRSQELSKAVLSVLNERERKIVEYLHEKGRSRQAKISRDCKIPKTSLSKILIKMEERGIIERERVGNLTFCELCERVYE